MLKGMIEAFIPQNELERLKNLENYSILDTEPEEAFDQLTKLAAKICETEISVISLLDRDRQWFKSTCGVSATEAPRNTSFCGHAIHGADLFIVENAILDPRFFDNPLVIGEPKIRFYAGMPLTTPAGFQVGVLCVVDTKPRKLTDVQSQALKTLANLVVTLFELRLSNQTLEKVSHQYNEVQKISKTGGWELDVATGKTIWSDEVYEIHGLPKGTPTSKIEGLSYYKDTEQTRLVGLLDRTINEGISYDAEFEFSDSRGISKWVRVSGKPFFNSQKKVIKVLGIIQDITDQVNARIKLQESNKYLDLAFEGTGLGIWDWDLRNNNVGFDGRWAKILGYELDEIEMNLKSWESRVHPEDLKNCFEDIQKYMKGEVSTYKNIHRMKHKNGHWVYILDQGKFSEWDKNGKPIRFTGTHLEVTQQMLSERLNSNISELRANYISNSEDQKAFFSSILDQLTGLTESQYGLIGDVLKDEDGLFFKVACISDTTWSAETKTLYLEKIETTQEYRNQGEFFSKIIKKKKHFIDNNNLLDFKISGLPGVAQRLSKVLCIPLFHKRDLVSFIMLANSQEGYSEDSVTTLKPYLEIVAEMIYTSKISKELERQKVLALHNSKLASIGQLAAGVGHEINNPLAIISGQLSLVEQHLIKTEKMDSVLSDRFNKSKLAVERISNIVKGLRTFARSDVIESAPFNIRQMTEETVSMLKELYQREGIEFTYINELSDQCIDGSRGRLQQVLVNLLTNARDAVLHKKDPRISIKLESQGTSIILTVEDNGYGVPEAIKEKIFDPFFTTKEINEGTGIGLALAKTIVKEHLGQLEMDSTEGRGTMFRVTLPETQRRPQHQSKLSETEVKLNNQKVLIVDDESDIREIFDSILTDLNFKVSTADSAFEALELIKNNQYDLVISDVQMPKMGGFEFLKKLRSSDLKSQPKFIFISGGVELSQKDLELIEKESEGFLPKPFTYELIQEKLNEIAF